MSRELKNSKKILGNALLEAAGRNSKIVLMSADSGPNSGFSSFIEKYPDRYYEFGIMEEFTIGASSGIATTGLLPIFCAPAPFVTGHSYEMFRIDLGYMHQNVKIIGRNTGFSYSDLGPTHYGLDDIALIRMIPGVPILAPQDGIELKNAFDAMLAYQGPCYMRIGSASMPDICENKPFEIGKGELFENGSDVAIISTGNTTAAVLEAVPMIKAAGISPMVIGMPTIVPIDADLIAKAAAKTGRIVTVEEHFIFGGLGSIVSDVCSERCPVPVKRIGVPNSYATNGSYDDMVKYYGLDPKSIATSVAQFACSKS